ncbi:extracellular solute-binding protein [Actinomyces sp. 2119]|uniref:sugar ABC transporter substrate-binding protein n=1 Tax=Actinomyces sp. 2119 TaxID=2321393 RepID=UPI000E6B7050|nr:extracellular solute-binding protein [Actinomyces sp. 2119]RJF40491.1 extracellular solute-binding protein [Actinomyces sp. 2119]RJF41848.1 extracellular solute-binding protein [Actinomyces sp. 2119]
MMISRRRLGRYAAALTMTTAVTAVLAACTGDGEDSGTEAGEDGLTLMISSSGEAETSAVRDALTSFTEDTGVAVRLLPATDLDQELSQSLASDSPVDVFYLDPHQLVSYADAGALHAYGDQLPAAGDYYPSLVANATYRGEVYGAPRGLSTLALFLNTELWEAAGLTPQDYPATWAELETTAAALAAGGTAGLVLTPDYATADAFMAQAGGGLVDSSDSAEGVTVTADSQASVAGLSQMKALVDSGAAVLSSSLDEGSGGDVFAQGQAGMTIAGYGLVSVLEADYPELGFAVIELPEGSAGRATVQQAAFYGVAEGSARKEDALRLVEHLTSAGVQVELAATQGLVPSVRSAADQWAGEDPVSVAFVAGAEHAVYAPLGDGVAEVLQGFEDQLASLADTEPEAILGPLQVNLEAATA